MCPVWILFVKMVSDGAPGSRPERVDQNNKHKKLVTKLARLIVNGAVVPGISTAEHFP